MINILFIIFCYLALEKDDLARSTGQDLGLIHSMKRLDSILNNERQPQEIDIDKLTDRKFKIEKTEMETEEAEPEIKEPQIEDQGDGVVEMVQEVSDEDIADEELDDDQEVIAVEEVKAEDKKKVVAEIELNESDSEEEETQTLSGKDLQQSGNSEQGRKWYKQNWK